MSLGSRMPGRSPQLRRGSVGRAVLSTIAATLLIGFGLHMSGRVPFAASRPAEAAIGAPAPDFELEEVGTGKKVRLSALRGKPVILNFYCGCGLCRAAAVEWVENKKKIPDVHMIAVSGDHNAYNPVNVKNFNWGTGWEWPTLADIRTKVTLEYKSVDCPRCWVIDAQGIIRHHNKDRNDPPATIVKGALAAVAALEQD